MLRSRTAWTCAVLYLLLAVVLFGKALSCTGIACDLVAVPAAFPAGFVVGPALDRLHDLLRFPGYTPTFYMRNPGFIAATVTANTVLSFGLGLALARLVR